MNRPARVLLAAGADRPGIVDRISGVVFDQGCNLEDSRMSLLGGEFALMMLITGSEAQLDAVKRGVGEIAAEIQLTTQWKSTHTEGDRDRLRGVPYTVHAIAMDHPGIVHKIVHELAKDGGNVLRLDTSLVPAPTTGTPMFSLRLDVELPTDVALASVRNQLEQLGAQENIDIELRVADA